MLKFFPNLLSISRVFMMFPLIFFLEIIEIDLIYLFYSIITIAMVVLSDVLDWFLARKLNHVTPLCKILDPVADKICLMIILIFLINKYNFIFFIFFILISIRDLILISLTTYLAIKLNYVSQANKFQNFIIDI